MKRENLSPYFGHRRTFRGTLDRTGYNAYAERPSLLLRPLADAYGNPLCEHIWIAPRRLPAQGIRAGDVVEFEAYVHVYYRESGTPEYGLCSVAGMRIVEVAR